MLDENKKLNSNVEDSSKVITDLKVENEKSQKNAKDWGLMVLVSRKKINELQDANKNLKSKDDESEQLKIELSNRKEVEDKLRADNEILENNKTLAKKTINDLHSKNKILKSQNDELSKCNEEQVAILKDEKERFLNKLEIANKKANKYQQENERLKSENDGSKEIKDQLTKSEEENAELDSKVKHLEEQLELAKKESQSSKEENEKVQINLAKRISELIMKMIKRDNELTIMNGKIDDLEKEKEEILERNKNYDDEKIEMSKEIDNLKHKLEACKDDLKQLEDKNDTFNNKMKDMIDKNNALQADVDKREKRMDLAEKKIKNQDQEIKNLNEMMNQKDNKIAVLKVDINEHKSAAEEKENLAKEMAEKDANIKILQENNQKLQNNIKALSKEDAKLLKIARRELERNRTNADLEIEKRDNEIKALKEQNIMLKQFSDNAKKNLKKRNDKINDLEKKLEEAKIIKARISNDLLQELTTREASGSGRICSDVYQDT